MVDVKSIEIREARIEDISQLLDLLNSQYNNKFNQEYFEWQYFNSSNDNKMFCAEMGARIVGMFGVLKKELNNGLIGLQASDMLLTENYRGHNIFSKLADYAFDSFKEKDFLFVIPNLNGKNAIEKNSKWETLFKINEWQLNINEFRFLPSWDKPNSSAAVYSFNYPESTLDWRFNQNPLYNYKRIDLASEKFSYVKRYEDPVTRRSYIDIVFFSDDNIQFEELVGLIKGLTKTEKKEVILSTWALPGTNLAKHLPNLGFTEISKERYFCLYSYSDKNLSNSGSWNIYQADTEFY